MVFPDKFTGKDWEHCIHFYKRLRERTLNADKFEVGNMMLDLIQKLSKDVYLREVSKMISHHCLRIGVQNRFPQIMIEWIPAENSYAVGQIMETQRDLEWSMVNSDNIIHVLQQGLQRLKDVSND